MTDIKQKLFPHEDELQAYEGQWKNLWFYKTGIGYGKGEYLTEKTAKETAEKNVRRNSEYFAKHPRTVENCSGKKFFTKDFLFVIQIPVKP